ncbi:MAG: methyltransferase domain-containing protein [Bacteroidia bacterium]
MNEEIKTAPLCCAPEPLEEQPYGQEFWNGKYQVGETAWDLNGPSPALVKAFAKWQNKEARILIPGCGSAWETDALLEMGFTHITLIDIAPDLVAQLKTKYADRADRVTVLEGDFFQLEGQFDVVVEQTFFCALPPLLRSAYVRKMYHLLASKGEIVGLLFNRDFEQDGPPYGGTAEEYKGLFEPYFHLLTMENSVDSHPKRLGTELFITFEKKCAECANLNLKK